MTSAKVASAAAILWLILLFNGLTSCATVTPATVVLASGQSVDSMGQRYLETVKLMNQARRDGSIPANTYAAWVSFSARFKPTFQLLSDAWDLAAKDMDNVMAGKIYEAILVLVGELGTFYNDALKFQNFDKVSILDGGTS